MKRLKPLVLTVLFLLILPGFSTRAVLAQGGPPLITDDPGTPGDGKWEINLALTAEKRRRERSYESPLLDINYGLGERIQLKYEVPWLALDERGKHTKNGLGNSLVGVKWRFFDQDEQGIDMSVYPQIEFNNSQSSYNRGLVKKGMGFVLPVQLQKSWGAISLNPEVGYVFHEYNGNEWIYGLAIGYQASSNLEVLMEVSGVTQQDFHDDELVFNLGARLELSDTRALLISAGRSFRGSASGEPQLLLYTGVQFNF